MAIYQGYFSGLCSNRSVWSKEQLKMIREDRYVPPESIARSNDFIHLRDHLKNTDDQFVFIITKAQWTRWNERLDNYDLRQFIHYEMPYFVSNRRYPESPRKLRLVILKGKKNED